MSTIALRRPHAPYRKGWCPGALRPMETGDGLLARVRAPRGRLSLDQAAALADAAIRCGNGVIGLSARSNLHLRGLSERTLPDLHARLKEIGLIDADPNIERLRNIVVSPLDDIDPEAFLGLGPSVAALEKRLREDENLRQLPAKFSFVLDAGGRVPCVSRRRRYSGCAMRAGRDRRCRGAAWPCISRRRWRGGAAADARF